MTEKYDSAALRHYKDATSLSVAGRLDNAGHLIGFAAECAIKYGVFTLGGDEPRYVHLPELRAIALKHLNGRGRRSNPEMLNLLRQDIFNDWSVNQRYCETGQTLQQELDTWFKVAGLSMKAAGIKERK